MKIAVVGGGYTGCLAALHAHELGAEISLFESASDLGGVLRDVEFNGNHFFNACQYLRTETSKLEAFGLTENTYYFQHHYGSLTSLNNSKIKIVDDCAQPVLDGEIKLIDKPVVNLTALERLKSYGSHADTLIKWTSQFGNLAELDYRCLTPMQVSRVYYVDDQGLAIKKASDPLADQLLALPRKIRSPGSLPERALLPKSGFNSFFDQVEEKLKDRDIQINKKSPVNIGMIGDKLSLFLRKKELPFDKIIWTANPTPLLRNVCNINLQTPPIRMTLAFGQFNKLHFLTPYYWQIFDLQSPITRVYVYELDGKPCFTVEAFRQLNTYDWQAEIQTLFEKLGLLDDFNIFGTTNQQRFVNFSSNEYDSVANASSFLESLNVIPGGWLQYGREEKILNIKKYLKAA